MRHHKHERAIPFVTEVNLSGHLCEALLSDGQIARGVGKS